MCHINCGVLEDMEVVAESKNVKELRARSKVLGRIFVIEKEKTIELNIIENAELVIHKILKKNNLENKDFYKLTNTDVNFSAAALIKKEISKKDADKMKEVFKIEPDLLLSKYTKW